MQKDRDQYMSIHCHTVIYIQHYDEKVVIAAGFDMKTVYHTPSSFNFTFNADPVSISLLIVQINLRVCNKEIVYEI